jgi:hypothetical protein
LLLSARWRSKPLSILMIWQWNDIQLIFKDINGTLNGTGR